MGVGSCDAAMAGTKHPDPPLAVLEGWALERTVCPALDRDKRKTSLRELRQQASPYQTTLCKRSLAPLHDRFMRYGRKWFALRSLREMLVAVIVLNLVVEPGLARDPRRDPATGVIRILYYGDAFAPSPYPTFVTDPLTSVVALTGMTGTALQIDKKMRIFMPRSYQDLLDKYDLLIMSDAIVQNFRTDYVYWFRNSVIEGGLGLLMIGGYGSFGGTPFLDSPWGHTVLQDALPVICIPRGWDMGDQSLSQAGVLEVVDRNDKLMRSLPFDSLGPYGVFHGCNIVELKPSSRLLANYRKAGGRTHPLMVYEAIGEGASFAMTSDWTPYGGIDFLRWPYYGDFALNLAAYITGNEVPQDVELAHKARSLMMDYKSLLETMQSVMEFVARFGANLNEAERMLAEISSNEKAGKQAYMDADLETSVARLQAALDDMFIASQRIWKLKDEALFWVYFTEWLVVAATGMICGFILWTIMVRRRFYRETAITRLHQC